ncbi:MAG: type I restriction-modification enzyme R subunit C-terminal domain-containing protein, partial [Polyangiaceae bacterium]
AQRKPIYTSFDDEIGEGAAIDLPGLGAGGDFERFRAKARRFLREHEDHITIHKVRMNQPLTQADLGELERLLLEAGVGTATDLARAKVEASGLGLFIRSLLGLDRSAAKEAVGRFLTGKAVAASQIEFVNLVVDHLTEHGVMEPARLYESPFTDVSPQGPEGVFTAAQVDDMVVVLDEIRRRAAI